MNPRFFVYLLLLLFVAIYGGINFKKLSLSFKLLSLLILFTLISESGVFPIKNSLILYHILLPTTMIMLWLIFSNESNNKRKSDYFITILFVFISISNSIWHQYDIFPSHGLALLCNLAVWLSLQTFKQMILLPSNVNVTKRPFFWLATFTLFFYCITFFSFTFYNFHLGIMWLLDLNFYSGFMLYLGYFVALFFDVNRNKYAYEN